MNSTKRLRIFAGPNGSGKSTLVKVVENLHIDLGIYINADNLKRTGSNEGWHFQGKSKDFIQGNKVK